MFIHTNKCKEIKYILNTNTSGAFMYTYKKKELQKFNDFLIESNNKNKTDDHVTKKVILKYDENIFPLFKLNRLIVNNANNIDIEFIVKKHKRTLLPYENFRFIVPETKFYIKDIFKDNLASIYLTKPYNDSYNGRQYNYWPFGNVYGSGNVCWGNRRIYNLGKMIKIFSKDIEEKDNVEVYLNMYMQYMYSEFFNSPFNFDLCNVEIIQILDITHRPTFDAIEKLLKNSSRISDKKHPFVYIKRNKLCLTSYVKPSELIRADQNMKEE